MRAGSHFTSVTLLNLRVLANLTKYLEQLYLYVKKEAGSRERAQENRHNDYITLSLPLSTNQGSAVVEF